ncbi:hypothetical protein ACFYOF_16940 [Streptomyces sp. NPDC007148]|uniref:hypothetical protein n=1 Tax=Streptomyces sp. NPDC007148 TaxID=3364775 RepID=UPI0036CF3977
MSDARTADRIELIKRISAALKGVTTGDAWHAVCLICELAEGRMDPADVQREFEELGLPPT